MERSEYFGELQSLVDELYSRNKVVSAMSLVLVAEMRDYPEDLIEICKSIPSGDYYRYALCDQLNSAITGHGWGLVYGTVD